MKKLYSYITAIIVLCGLLLSASSCTERMDIDTDKNIPRLIITGIITNDTTTHYVRVSQSVQYIGNEETKYFLDGIVKINDVELTVDHDQKAYATAPDFYGKAGETYKLDVWVDFDGDGQHEHYTASTTMPAYIHLDSIYLGAMQSSKPQGPPWMLFACFTNPLGQNYLGYHLMFNDYAYGDDLAHYVVGKDKPGSDFDGKPIKDPMYFIEDKMRIDEDNDYELFAGDTLKVSLHHLSVEYFNFADAATKEVEGGNPLFAGPPANVPSNISNGALGIFGSYMISRKQIILPETPDLHPRPQAD